MGLNKEIVNTAQNLTYAMSGWFRSFIANNHVQTGLMRDTTSTSFLTHQYANTLRFVWSLTSPEYFRYVERYRIENGMRPMMRLVKEDQTVNTLYSQFMTEIKKEFTIKSIRGLQDGAKEARNDNK